MPPCRIRLYWIKGGAPRRSAALAGAFAGQRPFGPAAGAGRSCADQRLREIVAAIGARHERGAGT
jgi:hypothetical protein